MDYNRDLTSVRVTVETLILGEAICYKVWCRVASIESKFVAVTSKKPRPLKDLGFYLSERRTKTEKISTGDCASF